MARSLGRRFVRAVKTGFRVGAALFSGNGGQGGRGWRRLLGGAQFDYEAQAGDLWRNSAIAACLRVVRVNFPEPLLEVVAPDPEGEDEDLAKVPGHELVARIDQPNEFYTHYELWAATVLSLIVDGNAYWLKVRSRAGKVVQLWWVPHWTMEPRYPDDGSEYITSWAYTINGRTYYLDPNDVVHFRTGIDPHNPRLGLADLKAGVREVCGDNEAAGYTAAVLRNSGVPSVVITPSDDGIPFADGEPERIKGHWRETMTGERRGDPLVTDSVKVAKLGLTPKELMLGDLPDRFEDRICALVGVNPMVAGLTSGGAHKTFANYAEARRALYEDTIIPLQKMVARTLTQQLLSDFLAPEGAIVRWSYKAVQCLTENLNDIATRVAMLYEKKLITQNEGRKAIGEKPTKGGDRFADGSTPDEGPQPPPPLVAPAGKGPAVDQEEKEETKRLQAQVKGLIKATKRRLAAAA